MNHHEIDALKAAITAALVNDRRGRTSGDETSFLCFEHDDHKPSASWNQEKGAYKCHACHAKGGYMKIAELLHMSWPNGSRIVTGGQGAATGPRVFPTAEEAVKSFADYKHAVFTTSWVDEYRDPDGTSRFAVGRFEVETNREGPNGPEFEKEMRPFHRVPEGWTIGRPKDEKLLPLFRVKDLVASPSVCFFEGEYKSDIARGVLQMEVTTTAFGAGKAKGTDLRPLAGKRVNIFPDEDDAGHLHAADVASRLRALDPPAKPYIVTLPGLSKGEDVHDFIKSRSNAGKTMEEIRTEILALIEGAPEAPVTPSETDGAEKPQVLIPGPHAKSPGVPGNATTEVGTDHFAKHVLRALPPGVLYRMDIVVGRLLGAAGSRKFERISENEMRILIDRHVRLTQWKMVKSPGGPSVAVPFFIACTRDLAAVVLAEAAVSSSVPKLEMLVNFPVCFGPDFKLVRPGWNECGVYYDEPPELVGLKPRHGEAHEILNDLVVDFPFRDSASRQNVFGAMLTLILRPAILGPTPFHFVIAALERTGKGKLVNVAVGNAVRGKGVPVMQIGADDAECEKRVTTLILDGSPIIHLDNIAAGELLDRASLASLATAYPTWKGRLLGVSQAPELPNCLVVFLSGNNPRVSTELVKRALPVVLQPIDDHPEDRAVFAHPDAEEYALSRRKVVIEVLLGMIEAWIGAGRPLPTSGRRMGGFEKWVAIVGGVMEHAGFKDWMANYHEWVRMADETSADAETLVRAWSLKYGAAIITPSQVLDLVTETGAFPFVLNRPDDVGRKISLAKTVLKPLQDRPVAGWRVKRHGSGSNARYSLVLNMPGQPPGGSGRPGDSGDSGDSSRPPDSPERKQQDFFPRENGGKPPESPESPGPGGEVSF